MLFADCAGGGTVYISSTRIKPSSSLPEARMFADLVERITAELRSQQVEEVALLETRKRSSLAYKDAYARVISVAALISAANGAQVPFNTHKTEVVGRELELPAKSLQTISPETIAIDFKPTYWSGGMAEAAAVAAFRA